MKSLWAFLSLPSFIQYATELKWKDVLSMASVPSVALFYNNNFGDV